MMSIDPKFNALQNKLVHNFPCGSPFSRYKQKPGKSAKTLNFKSKFFDLSKGFGAADDHILSRDGKYF